MATVPNKDGQDQFVDVHVYRPSEVASAKVGTTVKLPAGASAAGKPPVSPP